MIIQRGYRSLIDQYNNIRQSLLQKFFLDTSSVQFISSLFPLDLTIEMELFCTTPLSKKENDKLAIQYHGSYDNWTSTLLHISSNSRQNPTYTAMSLSGYTYQNIVCYHILYLTICYIYHHPLVPIMFQR